MNDIYTLALAHRDELLRQAAERRRAHQPIRTREAPSIRSADRVQIRLRVLRLRRPATP